jgi:hypothetical protein
VFACGRVVHRTAPVREVGSGRLAMQGHLVTCLACRRRYADHFEPIESGPELLPAGLLDAHDGLFDDDQAAEPTISGRYDDGDDR